MKENGCACDRCGDTYKIDLNLPDELWAKINPDIDDMLCPECIGELLKKTDEFGAYRLQSQVVDEVNDEQIELAGQQLQIDVEGEIRTFIWVFKEGAKWMQDKINEK